VGNTIEGNSIYSNTKLGIDLGNDGVTPNNSGPIGPNNFQNYPVLTSVSGTSASGTFDDSSEPNGMVRIEFFADAGNTSQHGEGKIFLGSTTQATDANGHAAFTNVALNSAPPAGDIVSATATILSTSNQAITAGDTSEFSKNVTPTTPTPTATKLAITQEPTPNPVSAGLGFDMAVSAETSTGQVDTSFNGQITLTIATGPNAGSQFITDTATNGVLDLHQLVLDTAGVYTLQATSPTEPSLTAATTVPLTVNPGQPSSVHVTSGPTPNPVNAGSPFSLVAQVEDGRGNVVTDYNQDVMVALESSSGNAGATLGGTKTKMASGGIAMFSDLTLTPPGNYLLVVSAANVTGTASDISITVNSATSATQLAVTAAPSPNPVTAGHTFTLGVSAENGSGAVDTNYTDNVMAMIMSGPTGATLGGTTMVMASAGVANFSDLNLDKAGDYTLKFTSGNLTPTTATITVNPSTATQLVVTQAPTPNPVHEGSTFTLGVSAEDQFDNVVTTYATPVAVAITNGPGGSLSGTTPITPSSGVATFSDLSLNKVGNYTLGLTSGSLSTTATISVSAVATKLVVTQEPTAPVTAGSTFTFAVTAEDSDGNIDTAYNQSVAVAINSGPTDGTLGGTKSVTPVNGVATFSTLTLIPSGTFTLQATSGTSPALTPATSGTITVNTVPTNTTLMSSANPSLVGQTVTFTAVITPVTTARPSELVDGSSDITAASDDPAALPTGTVTFTIDGNAQTPVAVTIVNNQAEATFPDASLAAGSHTIGATYSGDPIFAGSPAQNITQVVQIGTTTSVTATPSPGIAGQPITFTVTVSATSGTSVPTGNVNLVSGTKTLGSGTLGSNGKVSIMATLAAGTYSIVADYLGGNNFQPTNSQPLALTVNAPTPTITVTSASTSTTVGQTASFALALAGPAGSPTPTGTVTFLANGTSIGTAPVTNGQANFTISTLGAGSHTITANYSGDNTYAPTSTMVAALTVAKATPSTTLTSSLNPSAPGKAVTFTATVAGPTGSATPTGTVTFLDGTTTLGTGTLNASGVATFTTSTLTAGAHSITAAYGGDSNYLANTSTALTQQVQTSADGPTVTNLQRFGFHSQPTMLVLTFNQPLDPTRAQNTANYTVTGPSGSSIAVTSAVYSSANNTVTLSFNQLLNVHQTYTLTVNGMAPNGVTGTNGLLLDGANTGHPGSNYVKTFGMEILAGTAAEVAEAPRMLTLQQINHGQLTTRALEELVAQGHIKTQRHRGHATH
jgi:hypothetical protein